MAGSNRKFKYVSDDGSEYSIFRDESNTETLNSDFEDVGTIPDNTVGSLKDFYETRYALLQQVSNPNIKRKVTILSPDIFAGLDGGTDFSLAVVGATAQNFRITSLIGERRLRLFSGDSGQNDGDNESIEED